MYNSTKWHDRVVDADSGEVIQEGTDQSAANFNNMEKGISDAYVALALMQQALNLVNIDKRIRVLECVLTPGTVNDSSKTLAFPDGFTAKNCVLLSHMWSDEQGTPVEDGQNVFGVHFEGNGVHVGLVSGVAEQEYHIKVALYRYK